MTFDDTDQKTKERQKTVKVKNKKSTKKKQQRKTKGRYYSSAYSWRLGEASTFVGDMDGRESVCARREEGM